MDYKSKTLTFNFDSGAQVSLFSDNFYKQFKTDLDATGKKDSLKMGGAGGSRKMKILKVPRLSFTVDGKPVEFNNAQVNLDHTQVNDQYYHGNVGQDMIGQFDSMTINFVTSSILFGNSVTPAK